MINNKSLNGKYALITGSSSQLGSEFCKVLSLNGATIIATDVEEKQCEHVLKGIEQLSDKKHYIKKLDITSFFSKFVKKHRYTIKVVDYKDMWFEVDTIKDLKILNYKKI